LCGCANTGGVGCIASQLVVDDQPSGRISTWLQDRAWGVFYLTRLSSLVSVGQADPAGFRRYESRTIEKKWALRTKTARRVSRALRATVCKIDSKYRADLRLLQVKYTRSDGSLPHSDTAVKTWPTNVSNTSLLPRCGPHCGEGASVAGSVFNCRSIEGAEKPAQWSGPTSRHHSKHLGGDQGTLKQQVERPHIKSGL
jgi:hypothetical protein